MLRPRPARRRPRRSALVAALLLLPLAAGLVAAPPAAADAVAPGRPVLVLPFSAEPAATGPHSGGTSAANAAVSRACRGGRTLHLPHWYALPAADLGRVLLAGDARSGSVGHSPYVLPSGLAVVDTVTGAVVRCGGGVVDVRAARPLSFVVYETAAPPACEWDPTTNCDYYRLRIAPTTRAVAPANDHASGARTISALPYATVADAYLADGDGPDWTAHECAMPVDQITWTSSLWWRYTPPSTGAVSVRARDLDGDVFVTAGVAEATAAGPVPLPRTQEQCESGAPFVLQAGHTYLIAAHTGHEAYYGDPLVTGGRYELRVGAVRTPAAPVRVQASGTTSSTATLSWDVPPADGGSPVTGYVVSRDGRDDGGAGPWSATVPATARSQVFTHLDRWDTYRLSVRAVTARGTSPLVTRVVTVAAPTPSAPTAVTATPGSGRVALTWSAPLQRGSSAITGYRVRRYAGSTLQATTSVAASARSLVVTGLAAGTSYRFDVTAVNASGTGRVSARTPGVVPAAATAAPTAR